MKNRLTAIKVNLRILLARIEKMKFDEPDYEINAKLQKVELKVDELSDILIEIEAIEEL